MTKTIGWLTAFVAGVALVVVVISAATAIGRHLTHAEVCTGTAYSVDYTTTTILTFGRMRVTPITIVDPVGPAEIAARLGVERNTINIWRGRHRDFPPPAAVLVMGPIWNWADVEAWAAKPRPTGRRPI